MPVKTNAEKKETLELKKLQLEIAKLQINIEEDTALFNSRQYTADAARVYPLIGEVSSLSVKYAIDRVTEWFREDPESPIELVISSGGGSVFAGLALYDYLRMIDDAGCPVTTTAVGFAASMAGVLLQGGSTRVMTANSWLMIHEASTATWGKVSELRDEVELIDKLEAKMLAILAERSTLSAKQIKAKSARKDWWLSADEAFELGFVDAVR